MARWRATTSGRRTCITWTAWQSRGQTRVGAWRELAWLRALWGLGGGRLASRWGAAWMLRVPPPPPAARGPHSSDVSHRPRGCAAVAEEPLGGPNLTGVWPSTRAPPLALGADHATAAEEDPLAPVRLVVEQLQVGGEELLGFFFGGGRWRGEMGGWGLRVEHAQCAISGGQRGLVTLLPLSPALTAALPPPAAAALSWQEAAEEQAQARHVRSLAVGAAAAPARGQDGKAHSHVTVLAAEAAAADQQAQVGGRCGTTAGPAVAGAPCSAPQQAPAAPPRQPCEGTVFLPSAPPHRTPLRRTPGCPLALPRAAAPA